MSIIPVSLGIPFGLFIALVGIILLLATKYKVIAAAVIGVGLVIALATVLLIVLAVNSGM